MTLNITPNLGGRLEKTQAVRNTIVGCGFRSDKGNPVRENTRAVRWHDSKGRLRSEFDFDVSRRAESEVQPLSHQLNLLKGKVEDVEDAVRKVASSPVSMDPRNTAGKRGEGSCSLLLVLRTLRGDGRTNSGPQAEKRGWICWLRGDLSAVMDGPLGQGLLQDPLIA